LQQEGLLTGPCSFRSGDLGEHVGVVNRSSSIALSHSGQCLSDLRGNGKIFWVVENCAQMYGEEHNHVPPRFQLDDPCPAAP